MRITTNLSAATMHAEVKAAALVAAASVWGHRAPPRWTPLEREAASAAQRVYCDLAINRMRDRYRTGYRRRLAQMRLRAGR